MMIYLVLQITATIAIHCQFASRGMYQTHGSWLLGAALSRTVTYSYHAIRMLSNECSTEEKHVQFGITVGIN